MSERVDRIALVNPEGGLEIATRDGSERQLLAQGDRFFHFPAWSPHADRVAAIGGNRDRAGVFIFDPALDAAVEPAAEHTAYESGRNAPIYLYWSPSGEHISFIATRADEQSMGLHVANANRAVMQSGKRSHLVATGRPCFWDWTPDGRKLLVHVGGWDGERGAKLELVDPFAPAGMTKTKVARPGLFQSPGIAVSGLYRAFGHVSRKNELQLIVDRMGDEEKSSRIALRHEGVAAMSWSPTSDQLAYISPPEQVRTYYGPLRLLDIVSSDVRVLSDEIVLAFFWSPDGKRIAYFTVAQVSETVRHMMPDPSTIARDGGAQPEMMSADDDDSEEFDEDDKEDESELWLNMWVVEVETGSDRLVATFEPIDVFVNQFLPFFDQYAKSHRIWSPDSDALVLPMMRPDGMGGKAAHICVVPATPEDGRPFRIADGLMAFWSPR